MKILVRLLMGTAMVAAGLAGSATAAQAVPTNCSLQAGVPSNGASASCRAGTGLVRVVIGCSGPASDPVLRYFAGPWVGIGAVSEAVCRPSARFTSATLQLG
jgi:hypothetical protein